MQQERFCNIHAMPKHLCFSNPVCSNTFTQTINAEQLPMTQSLSFKYLLLIILIIVQSIKSSAFANESKHLPANGEQKKARDGFSQSDNAVFLSGRSR